MINVRERRSHGLNSARAKLEFRRAASPLVVVVLGFAIGLAGWLVILRNVGKQVYTPTRELSFKLDDASGVVGRARQELRFKGMPAGRVTKVELRNGRPVVTAKLYESFGRIYNDARVAVRPTTALEDMYFDVLDRGSKASGEVGADNALAASQVSVGVQAEDVLNTFKPDVRTQLATTLRNLGNGLDDRGVALRTAFAEVAPLVETAVELSDQLRRRSALTKELIHDTAALTGTLADRDDELRRLVAAGATTLDAINSRRSGLDATLTELPPTLSRVHSSFESVRDVLPRVDNALKALTPITGSLPDGLEAVRDLSATADPALRALRTPVRRLVPLAKVLGPVASDLASVVTALRPQVSAIDYMVKTLSGCPVAVQGFFQGTPSVLKFGDARGYSIRGDAVVDVSSGGGAARDPNKIIGESCAPGKPLGGEPGPGGSR